MANTYYVVFVYMYMFCMMCDMQIIAYALRTFCECSLTQKTETREAAKWMMQNGNNSICLGEWGEKKKRKENDNITEGHENM